MIRYPIDRITRALLLALATALTLAVQWAPQAVPGSATADAFVRDRLLRVMAGATPVEGAVVVDIDEASIAALGPWPWPRSRLADLAEQALADGAERVVFDMVLPDPALDDAHGDERLASLAVAGRVVLAQAFDFAPRETPLAGGVAAGALGSPAGADEGMDTESGADASSGAVSPSARATGVLGNHAGLSDAACVGNIGFVPDRDGVLRRLPLITAWQGQAYPGLALAALLCGSSSVDSHAAGDGHADHDRKTDTGTTRRMPTWVAAIPRDADGFWHLPFRHKVESFTALPFADALEGQHPELIKGATVFVGSSALGLADRVATPLTGSIAGVAVHVEAWSQLQTAAQGDSPTPPPSLLLPLLAVAGMAWLAQRLGSRVRLRAVLLPLLLGVAAWLALAAWTVHEGGAALVAGPLYGYAVLLLVLLPAEWAWAQRKLRARTRLLGRYVAQSVLDELLQSEGADPLTPRRADITVLVADMQGYTALTNQSSLEDAERLTREFLACITEPVWQHQGTLDKYTGDGLHAFWGAPIATPDHADRALDAAQAVLEAVRAFNAVRVARGEQPVRVRVGVASGVALVGDLGSARRSWYSAVGDCINFAARLQECARDLDVDVVCSAGTAERCRPERLRLLAEVDVRGLGGQTLFTPAR
jgi:adenylate cyclase